MGGGSSAGVGDVGGYGGHYPPPGIQSMEGATALDPAEMKYSCTMDFRSQGGEQYTNEFFISFYAYIE